jgi:hypothetical protein
LSSSPAGTRARYGVRCWQRIPDMFEVWQSSGR